MAVKVATRSNITIVGHLKAVDGHVNARGQVSGRGTVGRLVTIRIGGLGIGSDA
ncbi:MAG: hypothetical protein R3E57_03705 [Porticoccaceae bacterium]